MFADSCALYLLLSVIIRQLNIQSMWEQSASTRVTSLGSLLLLLFLVAAANNKKINAFSFTAPQHCQQMLPLAQIRKKESSHVFILPMQATMIDLHPSLSSLPLGMKNQRDNGNDQDYDKEISKPVRKVPFFLFPFIALVGLDLLLNIAVITKKLVMYYLTGEVQESPPWW